MVGGTTHPVRGALYTVVSLFGARGARERRSEGEVLEGRRCRRRTATSSPEGWRAPLPPLLSVILFGRGRASGWGPFSLEARTPPGSLEQCTLRERCNALSSLPDSVSKRRFPPPHPSPPRARREGRRRNARGERRVSDDRFRR